MLHLSDKEMKPFCQGNETTGFYFLVSAHVRVLIHTYNICTSGDLHIPHRANPTRTPSLPDIGTQHHQRHTSYMLHYLHSRWGVCTPPLHHPTFTANPVVDVAHDCCQHHCKQHILFLHRHHRRGRGLDVANGVNHCYVDIRTQHRYVIWHQSHVPEILCDSRG